MSAIVSLNKGSDDCKVGERHEWKSWQLSNTQCSKIDPAQEVNGEVLFINLFIFIRL